MQNSNTEIGCKCLSHFPNGTSTILAPLSLPAIRNFNSRLHSPHAARSPAQSADGDLAALLAKEAACEFAVSEQGLNHDERADRICGGQRPAVHTSHGRRQGILRPTSRLHLSA